MLVELQKKNKYSTDKQRKHGYLSYYEHYLSPLQNAEISLLEIGIARGGSIKLWNDYFSRAKIIGVDISQENIDKVAQKMGLEKTEIDNSFESSSSNVSLILANSMDRKALCGHFNPNQFDIIIDDGNHSLQSQILTFCYLYPFLKPGGLYFIEDIVPSFLALESLKGLAESTFHFPNKSEDSILMAHRKEC